MRERERKKKKNKQKKKKEEEEEEEDGCCSVNNGISASGVQIQTHRRRAYQPLPQVENQRPRFRGPGHSRNRRLQMGALGFTWYISIFLLLLLLLLLHFYSSFLVFFVLWLCLKLIS